MYSPNQSPYLISAQSESRERTDDYNRKARQLHTELEGLKMQKANLRTQIVRGHAFPCYDSMSYFLGLLGRTPEVYHDC